VKTKHTACIIGTHCQQTSVPAMPINKTHYNHNIDVSCDTADNQQHKEELIRITNGQSSPGIHMEDLQHTAMYG